MASVQKAHPENVPGPLFVDTTCIDCGTCFHLGPEIFREEHDSSVVGRQPRDLGEWSEAKRAILSCPTHSIGIREPAAGFTAAPADLPLLIAGEVYYCGYTSRDSYGATSYLIRRPAGNVLVDSPRFTGPLVRELEALGGVAYMFLSHQDDVADHRDFARHFGCQRIIHRDDLRSGTADCELVLSGATPLALADDLKVIPTPGHTKGHLCLLYKEEFLFTGDHIFYDPGRGRLTASRGVCWYSWPEQIRSTEILTKETFRWIMPGHGGWGQFKKGESRDALELLLADMKGRP